MCTEANELIEGCPWLKPGWEERHNAYMEAWREEMKATEWKAREERINQELQLRPKFVVSDSGEAVVFKVDGEGKLRINAASDGVLVITGEKALGLRDWLTETFGEES